MYVKIQTRTVCQITLHAQLIVSLEIFLTRVTFLHANCQVCTCTVTMSSFISIGSSIKELRLQEIWTKGQTDKVIHVYTHRLCLQRGVIVVWYPAYSAHQYL